MTFEETPCADRHFAAIAGRNVWPKDGRATWRSSGSKGFCNEDVGGMRSDAPRFRYGIQGGVAFLSVSHADYVYRRTGDIRQIVITTGLPATAVASMDQRPLHDVLKVPGCDDDVIEGVGEEDGDTFLTLRDAV